MLTTKNYQTLLIKHDVFTCEEIPHTAFVIQLLAFQIHP